ncbi:MAG: hypothetical protein WAQ98_04435, partial [Blastocatellia bacterium]
MSSTNISPFWVCWNHAPVDPLGDDNSLTASADNPFIFNYARGLTTPGFYTCRVWDDLGVPTYAPNLQNIGNGDIVFYWNGSSIVNSPATCTDGIQNQDETGIDIGGVCEVVVPPVCTVDCFSNVLFLPGLKASVLKQGDSDEIWPPNSFSNDLDQLAMTDEGESVYDIYVDGILNKFYGTDIYQPFSDFMDNLSGPSHLINKWLPLAYDWRFSSEHTVKNGIKTKNGILDIVNEIEKLATDSKTGKIAIVAHSMGGLLGKAIIKELQARGKDDLIESFVMVGTPQLGTPQAIASLLHGDGEGIAAGFVVNQVTLRPIIQNMPSAFNLLPSRKYFDLVAEPVIKFNEQSFLTQVWRNFWGLNINNYSEFFEFITGGGMPRVEPLRSELNIPEILNPTLMQDTDDFHSIYDNYIFPEHIRVIEVAGWGLPTIKSIEYITRHGKLNYKTNFTRGGDKTVVYPSAVSSNVDEEYYFNLFQYNKTSDSDIQHRDILSSVSVKNIINAVVKRDNIVIDNFISKIKQSTLEIDDALVISTHSPVILGTYDQFGNFTGIELNQDLSQEVLSVREDIPNSSFISNSDGQYIFLPKDGVYDFVYKGVGDGPTTVEVDSFVADDMLPIVSYTDIPTTVLTKVFFEVSGDTPENTILNIDQNGDGIVDEIIHHDEYVFSIPELLVILKDKINTLKVKQNIKKSLLQRVENLDKKFAKKKGKNWEKK